jgi:hypothetical protein
LLTQALFVQMSPLGHASPQPPQLDAFDVVSMQLAGEPQSIWPAVVHPHTPPLHVDPPVHTVQLLPQ